MNAKQNWLIEGLIAGVIFFVVKSLIELLQGEFPPEKIWISVIVFLIAGLGYGLTMKYTRSKRKE